jgi:hypothetical protein
MDISELKASIKLLFRVLKTQDKHPHRPASFHEVLEFLIAIGETEVF